MFKLFLNNNDNTSYPIKKYSKFRYIRDKYLSELEKVKSYYRTKERAVENKHVLSRLVRSMTPSLDIPIYEYLTIVGANARLLSKQFDIVSNIHSGAVLDNVFYGKGSKEVLLYTEAPIDIDDFEVNWIDYKSVTVMYSENTDLDFRIPFNDKTYDVPELTILSVDVILLMLQYYMWANKRMTNDQSTNTNVFISQVVLPNMLDDMLDIAIFNRFFKLVNGDSIDRFSIKHPFFISDYSAGVDLVLADVVKDLAGNSMPVMQMLNTIPTIVNSDMAEVLYIKHKYYTVQSEWVLWIARIPVIDNIIQLLGNKGIRRNTDLLNRLPVLIKQMERSRTIDNKLGSRLYTNFMFDLDNIKEKIGRR